MERWTRNLVILTLGLICLAISLAIELGFGSVGEWHLHAISIEAIATFLRELAFALIIALLIIVSIETDSRRADRAEAAQLRKDIAKDVFKGVFSSTFPTEYVDAVVRTNLEPSLMRSFLSCGLIVDTVEQHQEIFRSLGLDLGAFVSLRSNYSYSIRNISLNTISDSIRIEIPAISGPIGSMSRLSSFRVSSSSGPDREKKDKLSDVSFQKIPGAVRFFYPFKLGPDEDLDVEIETYVIKESSDTEIWGSSIPAMRADVSLMMRVPGFFHGLQARTATEPVVVISSQDGSLSRWRFDGPLLPNDSITVWWTPK